MFAFKSLRPRVSVQRKQNGSLVITIARNNNWATYILMLIAFTGVFLWFISVFARPVFREPLSRDNLYILPFVAFILVWYAVGLRISLWRSFGVEEIVIEHNELRWTRTALFWKRNLQIPVEDITAVRSVTPWHGQSNRVQLIAHGRLHTIGDMLLHDETIQLAERLRKAVGRVATEP